MRKRKSLVSFLLFLITLAIFDRFIEILLKPFLHRKRDKFIQNAIDQFQSVSSDAAVMLRLTENLNEEADRVYAIVDRSILRERIIRAKYTFFATALSAIILVGSLGAFTGGSVIPFITPLAMACVAWLSAILTIAVSYHQRVKGAMDSVLIKQTGLLAKVSLSSSQQIRKSLQSNADEIKIAISFEQDKETTAPDIINFSQSDNTLAQMEEGQAIQAAAQPDSDHHKSLRP